MSQRILKDMPVTDDNGDKRERINSSPRMEGREGGREGERKEGRKEGRKERKKERKK